MHVFQRSGEGTAGIGTFQGYQTLKHTHKPGLTFRAPHLRPTFSCLRLCQWPVTYLIMLSDWIMNCQPGRHAVVTVCEPDWKHKCAAYKSFDETSSFNNL